VTAGRRRPGGVRLVAGLVLVAIWAVLSLLLAAPAQAHTELERSNPPDGARLDRLPRHAKLVFSEEVPPKDVTVIADGVVLPDEAVPGMPQAVSVDLGSVEPARTVVLSWKVIDSHDGHETEGALELHVRGSGGADPAASADAGPPSEPRFMEQAEVGTRTVGYLSMAVLIGGLLFVSLLWPAGAQDTRTRAVLVTAVVTGVAAAAGELAVALWRADGSQTLTAILTEDYGRVYAAMMLLWLLAAVVVVGVIQAGPAGVRRLPWRVGAAVVALGLVRCTSMNAHASEAAKPFLGAVADLLHLTAVSAWVGGLVVLTVGVLPRRRLDELEEVVPKFSRVAQVSVAMLVGSGLILVWQVIGPIDDFWGTHYSRVLLVKLSLFVVVLLAAMKSKRWVDRALAGTHADRGGNAVRSIATSVAAETLLVAAVLGAASVLATSSPGL